MEMDVQRKAEGQDKEVCRELRNQGRDSLAFIEIRGACIVGFRDPIFSMALNDYDYRPITFEGEVFPPTLMGIAILERVLGIKDEELADWLWRLPICCGVTQRAPADRCVRCAQRTVELMLENRERVWEGIRARLVPEGFDVNGTFSDWIASLQRIAELSAASDGECVWSAPAHDKDSFRSAKDVHRLFDAIEREQARSRHEK